MYAIAGTAKKYNLQAFAPSGILTLRLGTQLVARWCHESSSGTVGRAKVFHASTFEVSPESCMPDKVTAEDRERYKAWIKAG
jgi:hypothetical protein